MKIFVIKLTSSQPIVATGAAYLVKTIAANVVIYFVINLSSTSGCLDSAILRVTHNLYFYISCIMELRSL